MGLSLFVWVPPAIAGIFEARRRVLMGLIVFMGRKIRPLIAGGTLCLMLLLKGYIGFVAPFTLIFYGLALVNASKYTLTQVRSLGLLEIALGLIATHFIGYGLIFWAIGFGVLHIIYGLVIQRQDG